jgi:hypothetical protein
VRQTIFAGVDGGLSGGYADHGVRTPIGTSGNLFLYHLYHYHPWYCQLSNCHPPCPSTEVCYKDPRQCTIPGVKAHANPSGAPSETRPPSTETRQSESASQAAKTGQEIPAVGLRVIGRKQKSSSEQLEYKGENTKQDEDERPW